MVWKIAVTLIITFIALAVVISTTPPVGNFFANVKEKVLGIVDSDVAERSVDFQLSWDSYNKLEITTKRTMNITIRSISMKAEFATGVIQVADKNVAITNFRGTGTIDKNQLNIDGVYEEMRITGVGTFDGGNINLESSFSELNIENLAFAQLSLQGSGTLSYDDNELDVNEETILITSPLGVFTFNDAVHIQGSAAAIKVGVTEIK